MSELRTPNAAPKLTFAAALAMILLALAAALAMFLLVGFLGTEPTPGGDSNNLRERLEAQAAAVTDSAVERREAVLDGVLPIKLGTLTKSVLNLAFPSADALKLFADVVELVDLEVPEQSQRISRLDVEIRHWEIASAPTPVPLAELSIWSELLDEVAYFRHAKFKLVRGHFLDADEHVLETLLKFEGLACCGTGFRFVKAAVTVVWENAATADGSDVDWRIRRWITEHVETHDVHELLFTDVMGGALGSELYTTLSGTNATLDGRIAEIIVNRQAGRTFNDLNAQWDDTLLPYTKAELDKVTAKLNSTGQAWVRLYYGEFVRSESKLAQHLNISTKQLKTLEKKINRRLAALRRKRRPEVAARVARNFGYHEEIRQISDKITDKRPDNQQQRATLQPTSGLRSGIAVVDIDGDSFDDLFVSRGGRSYLLRNCRDGTFEDYTDEINLPQTNRTYAALFLDTDNDGDQDLFLASFGDGLGYYVNEKGRFVDRTRSHLQAYQPSGNASMSAADFNADGLIDVYVSTHDIYRPTLELMSRANFGIDDGTVYGMRLPDAQARRFYEYSMAPEADSNFARPGPPNMLLQNMGNGSFSIAPGTEHLEVYRSTHDAAWSDYDSDGDPDLYLANDFAPNNLFRNDQGVLVDVTSETGTADVGFGMGVTWGDYDNDGDHDLYVTNMYSKAGLRITEQAGLKESRAHVAAHGNTLFRNDAGAFKKVSGDGPPWLTVELGGWGWGAQFLDIDNDSFLDIYAPCGYVSPPPGLDSFADT